MTTWSERIRGLRDAGMTLAQIAHAIELSPSAVGDLATGRTAEPCGEAAVKLHELHREKCGGLVPGRAASGTESRRPIRQ